MTPFYDDGDVTVYAGDCLKVLRELPDASVDSVCTDPPYGIGWLGHEWDQFGQFGALSANHGGSNVSYGGKPHPAMEAGRYDLSRAANVRFGEWCQVWAAECLRILKPGGHILVFGSTRTHHRLACGIEDAGFELRDEIHWVFGQGFPKSLNVSKAIDRHLGVEPTKIGERLVNGGIRNDGLVGGSPRMDERPGDELTAVTVPTTATAATWDGWGSALKPAHEPIVVGRKPIDGTVAGNVLAHGTGAINITACRVPTDEVSVTRHGEASSGRRYTARGATNFAATPGPRGGGDAGRWPPNVLLTHAPGCQTDCVMGCPVAELDDQSGVLTSGANPTRRGSDKFRTAYGEFTGETACVPARGAESGGASRFFPAFRYEAKAPASERPEVDGVQHSTVKPLGLMRWIVRLVTPPQGVVLDPFLGSGTTAEAAVIEGFRCIGIERDPTYLPLIVARLSKPIPLDLFGAA